MSEKHRKKVIQFPPYSTIFIKLTTRTDRIDPAFDMKSLGKHLDAVRDGAVNVFVAVDQASPDPTCR